MIQITEEALTKLEELLRSQGGEHSAIRVAVMGGTGLGLIVDEAGAEDVSYDFEGVPLVIDRGLLEYCRSITIDFTIGTEGKCDGASGSGFLIVPTNPLNL